MMENVKKSLKGYLSGSLFLGDRINPVIDKENSFYDSWPVEDVLEIKTLLISHFLGLHLWASACLADH